MTVSNSKSYLGYFKKLVDEYKNIFNRTIGKKVIHIDYSALTEEIESSHETLKFEKQKNNIFSKGYTESRSKYIFVTDSVLKTNPWMYKTVDLNGEKVIESLYENKSLIKLYIKIKSK